MPAAASGIPATGSTHRSHGSAAGITFAIDTTPDAGPGRGAFKMFAGVVVFAAGRGRLDIIGKSGGPAISVNGITIAAPLAAPGDYYLFDSTGFALVRPADKTFSSVSLPDASYNYRENRDGWPESFEFGPLHGDTLAGDDARLTQHGLASIYWHLDLNQQAAPVRILARGRLAIQDTPAGEVSVVRWFGATQALANIQGGVSALLPESLRITAVAALSPPDESRAPINVVTQHAISALKIVNVDLSQLVLPAGFSETPWPGFEHAPNLPVLSPGTRAKWRAVPEICQRLLVRKVRARACRKGS